MDYVDLYLVHWPTPVEIPGFERRLWRAMEALVESGLCKTIGVSNYQIGRLQKVLSIASILPAVNQVRCSPFNYPSDLHNFCRKHGITLEGYGPLTQGAKLDDQTVKTMAEKYHKSVAQILLRWALQKDIIVIPKTQSKERIHENIALFDFVLTDNDMEALDSLATSS